MGLAKNTRLEIAYIFLLFFSTRFILTTIGVFARAFLGRQYGKQFIWSQQTWLDLWGVWDSFWYMDIAENGYSEVGRNFLSPDQANYAFFPLYPLLMRFLGTVLGNRYYLAGVIISNICIIVSSILLYKLVQLDSDEKTALQSVKYLFLFPTAFIFSGVFTESLYLCLVLLCFYLARTKKWMLVGIAGFFLALTRSLGVLMIVPLTYEYLKEKKFRLNQVRLNSLFLLFIPLGLLVFAVYNFFLAGDFLAFKDIQAAWNREMSDPFTAIISGFQQGLFKSDFKKLLEAAFTAVSLLLLIAFFRKVQFSYWLFAMFSILVPLTGGVDSIPRYVLPVFPLFILLAKLSKNRDFDDSATLSLGLLQGFLMALWTCGFPLVI